MVRCQSLDRHCGPKVRASNPDIHNIRDLATLPHKAAFADIGGKAFHACQCLKNVRHHVLSVHNDRATIQVAQRRVQHSTAFGFVDRRTGEHRIAFGGNT